MTRSSPGIISPLMTQGILRGLVTERNQLPVTSIGELPPIDIGKMARRDDVPKAQLLSPAVVPQQPGVRPSLELVDP